MLRVQVDAFADYKAGGGAQRQKQPEEGKKEAASAAQEEPAPAEEEPSGGGGGDFPPHTVMALPALSPTMSQGACVCVGVCVWEGGGGQRTV